MHSLNIVAPELLLVAGSIFVLLAGLWFNNKKFLITAASATLITAFFMLTHMTGKPMQDVFNGLLSFDPFGHFFSVFAVLVTLFAIWMSARSAEIPKDRYPEFVSILLALCTGLIFMATSNHLLMVYLALETVSILSYTLAGFSKNKSASVEASLKYVVYGSMASAIMVYGMSLIYGVTGHLEMTGIREYILQTPPEQIPTLLWVATLLVFAGIGYKISAAPMHMWTPDVYEGAPTPVSALLSVGPKAAGFALLIRFFVTSFTLPVSAGGELVTASTDPAVFGFQIVGQFDWPKFLMISSIFTMFMGNLAALGQVSVKRILAYSSIAHAGYVLMGITTQTMGGLNAVLFYLVIYCVMNLGAFWIASLVEDTYGGDYLRHFRGLGTRRPFHAFAMAVFMFSLVGLPPFAGFIGKLYLFSAIIAREMYGFAILAAINSVISLGFYIRVIKAMYLDAPEVEDVKSNTVFDSKLIVGLLSVLVVPNILLGLYWEPVMRLAQGALRFFAGS